MKKLLKLFASFLLVLVLAFNVSACGNSPSNETEENQIESPETPSGDDSQSGDDDSDGDDQSDEEEEDDSKEEKWETVSISYDELMSIIGGLEYDFDGYISNITYTDGETSYTAVQKVVLSAGDDADDSDSQKDSDADNSDDGNDSDDGEVDSDEEGDEDGDAVEGTSSIKVSSSIIVSGDENYEAYILDNFIYYIVGDDIYYTSILNFSTREDYTCYPAYKLMMLSIAPGLYAGLSFYEYLNYTLYDGNLTTYIVRALGLVEYTKGEDGVEEVYKTDVLEISKVYTSSETRYVVLYKISESKSISISINFESGEFVGLTISVTDGDEVTMADIRFEETQVEFPDFSDALIDSDDSSRSELENGSGNGETDTDGESESGSGDDSGTETSGETDTGESGEAGTDSGGEAESDVNSETGGDA